MMYQSSKGAVAIDTLPYSYALNARNKLVRTAPERVEEIAALNAHIAALDAVQAEKNRIGANHPPEDTPAAVEPTSAPTAATWAAVKMNMDDLLEEAANWADGVAIVRQQQADDVGKLRVLLQDAAAIADETRVAEKAPLDKQIAEIQDRYNAYIAPMKNKVPGSISKSVHALNNLLSAWLNKLDQDRREREAAARKIADDAHLAAIQARKALEASSDLAAIDDATSLLDAAEDAAKALKTVEREKVQVKIEGVRAVSLRSYWSAHLIEGQGGVALKHYAQSHPERVKAFLQAMADEDVKAGIRAIPGFTITEDRRL